MEPHSKLVQETKLALEKQHGREFPCEEAKQVARGIQAFAGLLLKAAEEEVRRKRQLEKNPKGYHFDKKGYRCCLCDGPASMENSWYDNYGLKCMICQDAINKKVIPGLVAKNKDTWYSKYELEMYFNLKGKLLTQCLKQGILKSRIIQRKNGKVHLQPFLIKDNKDVLPPKNLLQSRMVKVMKDGEEYYTSEHWYEFVDEKTAKKIAKYQIAELFPYTFSQPIETGRFYSKNINPLFMQQI